MRGFIGIINWLRDYIPNCFMKLKNLTEALNNDNKNKIKWTTEMDQEFINIKEEIKNIKPLAIPDYDDKFLLRTDTSNNGVGQY